MKYIGPTRKIKHSGEQGSALAAALCLVFMAGMLTAAVLSLSRIATFDVRAHVELQRSAYINEGVANRIQFLLAADRNVHSSGVQLGELDYSEYEYDRYTADGIPHIVDYHGTEVKVVIQDAVSGFNLNSSSYRRTLQSIISALQLEDDSVSDRIQPLIQRITDYIDSNDDLAGDDGMEVHEYEAENLAPLPRNGNLRYREELLFIPGLAELFKPDSYGMLSCIRLISPYGMTDLSRGSSNPGFFTADRLMLKVQGQLEDEQVEEIVQAREEWYKNKTRISEQLDELLTARLRSRFSFRESGFFTIRIEAPEKSGRPSRRLFFTFPAFDITGPQNNLVRYYDWLML